MPAPTYTIPQQHDGPQHHDGLQHHDAPQPIIPVDINMINLLPDFPHDVPPMAPPRLVRQNAMILDDNDFNDVAFQLPLLIIFNNNDVFNHQQIDNQQIDHQQIDHQVVNNQQIDYQAVDNQQIDHQQIDHQQIDHQAVDHQQIDHQAVDNQQIDHQAINNQQIAHQAINNQQIAHQADNIQEFINQVFLFDILYQEFYNNMPAIEENAQLYDEIEDLSAAVHRIM